MRVLAPSLQESKIQSQSQLTKEDIEELPDSLLLIKTAIKLLKDNEKHVLELKKKSKEVYCTENSKTETKSKGIIRN